MILYCPIDLFQIPANTRSLFRRIFRTSSSKHSQGQHFVVQKDGYEAIEWSRQQVWKFEAREPLKSIVRPFARHRENHAVRFPLESILDVELLKHLVDVRVRSEEDVQTSLHPVSIFILPCRNFAPQNVTSLKTAYLSGGAKASERQTRSHMGHLQRHIP